MTITSIKQQVKNSERVSLFVDGKYALSLSLTELLNERLKVGTEIDEARLKVLKKTSDDGKLYMRVLNWVTIRPHSTKEFNDYLRRKKVEPEQVEALRTDFTEKGYLNDEQFAKWFIAQRSAKNKSTRAITAELRAKGISSVTIQSIVTQEEGLLDKANDKEALKATLNKLRMRPRYQDQDKLIRYLMSKGFVYSDIKDALAGESSNS